MYKVLLICAGGMSTSFILKNIQKEALLKKIDLKIQAVGALEVKNVWEDFDIFLVAPQVRFELENIKSITQNSKKVITIDTVSYGRMDGKAILDMIVGL